MNDASESTLPVAGPRTEKRWPAILALVTAGLLPATTARRTRHLSIAWAIGVHVVSVIMVGVVIIFPSAQEIGQRAAIGRASGT